jgi:hypothetical protein
MSTPPLLAHADLWHTGIVVDDLAAATSELGEQLGVQWKRGGAEVVLLADTADGVISSIVRTAYVLSVEGPHHIEVMQSIPGTLWQVSAPGRAHHIGYWVDDVAAVSAALAARGSPRVAAVALAEEGDAMCAYHRSASGLYFEIVDRRFHRALLGAT